MDGGALIPNMGVTATAEDATGIHDLRRVGGSCE